MKKITIPSLSGAFYIVFLVGLAAPLAAHADECPWMSVSRIDQAYPEQAPWSVMVGGQGRCKFLSDQSKPVSAISLTQMLKASPAEAQKYVETIHKGMEVSYDVKSLTTIGSAGVAVRNRPAADSQMLTLAGHQKNVVVMTQMTMQTPVNAAQQAQAEKLTQETFGLDTGGGLQMPARPKK